MILVAVDLVLRAAAASIDFPERESFHTTAQTILGSDWPDSLLVNICGSRFEDYRIRDRVPLLCLCRLYVRFGSDVRRTRHHLSQSATNVALYVCWASPYHLVLSRCRHGYIFMVCLFAALVITMYITELYYSMSLQLIMNRTSIQYIGYLLLCYLAIYAGITRLIMLPVAKHVPARMLVSFAMMVVIMLVAHMLPLIVVYAMNDYREFDYDWHQAANIFGHAVRPVRRCRSPSKSVWCYSP